jgi:hypothetical protein
MHRHSITLLACPRIFPLLHQARACRPDLFTKATTPMKFDETRLYLTHPARVSATRANTMKNAPGENFGGETSDRVMANAESLAELYRYTAYR